MKKIWEEDLIKTLIFLDPKVTQRILSIKVMCGARSLVV